MTADNASSNKVQAAALCELDNSFENTNHIRCFNYTIQLSSKVLIKPFNAEMGKADTSLENTGNDIPSLEEFDYTDDTDDNVDSRDFSEDGNKEDNGEFEKLSEEEHSYLLDDMSAICETVSKALYGYTTIFLLLTFYLWLFGYSAIGRFRHGRLWLEFELFF